MTIEHMAAAELDLDAKKTVLRLFTYGLFAVSASHNGERGIFTANWVSQASFDPPIVMLSVERESSTLDLIRGSGRFVIAPFKLTDRELAANLGRPKSKAGDKFAAYQLELFETSSGDPAVRTLPGYLVCRVETEVGAGDSVVLVAEVIEARIFEATDPLTMRDAGFRHFG